MKLLPMTCIKIEAIFPRFRKKISLLFDGFTPTKEQLTLAAQASFSEEGSFEKEHISWMFVEATRRINYVPKFKGFTICDVEDPESKRNIRFVIENELGFVFRPLEEKTDDQDKSGT